MDDPHAQELLDLIREEHLPCPSCGYELGRLAECRCPECGAGLGIELWPGFGPAREIETFVRLRGPLRLMPHRDAERLPATDACEPLHQQEDPDEKFDRK